MLRYWTAGESHGKALIALVDGFPAGVTIDNEFIDRELRLRQGGYGRGGRQKLEQDHADFLTGVWQGSTLGSPITMQVVNNDYKLERLKELERPRPGHADLTGAIKYLGSIRGVLERSSARETAARVAAGALARLLLREFGIETLGYVVELGQMPIGRGDTLNLTVPDARELRDQSSIYAVDPSMDKEAEQYIDRMADEGDTLGGVIEVRVDGLPFGLGTHAQWDRKLDGKLAQAVMAVQAIKGVEIGMGFEAAPPWFPGARSDPLRRSSSTFPQFGLCASHQQCRGTRRWHDQWPKPDLACREKTNQHAAKAVGFYPHGGQGVSPSQLRAERRVRYFCGGDHRRACGGV